MGAPPTDHPTDQPGTTANAISAARPHKSPAFRLGLAIGWLFLLAYVVWLIHNAWPWLTAGAPLPPPPGFFAHLIVLPALPAAFAASTPSPMLVATLVAVLMAALFLVLLALTLVPLPAPPTVYSARTATSAAPIDQPADVGPTAPTLSADSPSTVLPLTEPPITPATEPPVALTAEPLTKPPIAESPFAAPTPPAPSPTTTAQETQEREELGITATATGGATTTALPEQQRPHTRRVFISHASADNAFGAELVDHLRMALQDSDDRVNYDLWYDSRGRPGPDGLWEGGIAPAANWQDEIQRALQAADVLLVLLSPAAMASPWVADEISLAWSRKNINPNIEAGLVVVPVLLAPCAIPPWLTLIQWVDFTTWHPPAATPETPETLDVMGAPTAIAEVDAHAWAALLSAVRDTRTRARPVELVGPPFDLATLPPLERFIGRAQAVEQVISLLTLPGAGQQANVAAANGLGGIGKTALATEVARRLMGTRDFPDGIAVVDCRDQHTADAARVLLRRVLSRFTEGRKEPDADDAATLSDAARQLLTGKRALVLLDNIEADLPAAQLITPLRGAGVAVLSTSREPLAAVPASATLRLDVLPEDEALALFTQYYGHMLAPAEERDARAILRALGRHTLATKLAAANAAALGRPLTAMARDLETHPDKALLLANAEEAVLWVLESSVASLPFAARRLFAALAAFATGDLGRQAVLSIASAALDEAISDPASAHTGRDDDPETSLDHLLALRLVDSGYVETRFPGDEEEDREADRERVRVHPLVRAYALGLFLGKRTVAGDHAWRVAQRDRVETAIATWYDEYTARAPDLALVIDEGNLLGALEQAEALTDSSDAETADAARMALVGICLGISGFWINAGRTRDALHWLPIGMHAAADIAHSASAAEVSAADAPDISTMLELLYARTVQITGRIDEAEKLYEHVLSYRHEVGDRGMEATVLNNLGGVEWTRGQLDEADDYFRQSLTICVRSAIGVRRRPSPPTWAVWGRHVAS